MRNYQHMQTRLRTHLAAQGLRLIDLAKLAGVDKATATRWAQHRVPAERVLEVERVTGISRHDIRPDLYPRERGAA